MNIHEVDILMKHSIIHYLTRKEHVYNQSLMPRYTYVAEILLLLVLSANQPINQLIYIRLSVHHL